ncbi:hypothetical protein [Agriterribacter sp.]|uniref:hypothetical protein n=1 Tax=Agriterribacter sp. TaxID=2821509 RepID=UPI002C804FAD|nr:hypothetical protein [Agriterribacter sp.]HRP56874.1 hypothetical protein [Agriterribacter sp.]
MKSFFAIALYFNRSDLATFCYFWYKCPEKGFYIYNVTEFVSVIESIEKRLFYFNIVILVSVVMRKSYNDLFIKAPAAGCSSTG